jgi:RNA polymerase sigma-70 factor (ECF subfamily)
MDDLYPLIEAEIPRLRRYARSLSRNTDDADDLVQECLLKAVRNLQQWERGTNLRSWLFVILRNGFINDRRRAGRSPIASETEVDYSRHGGLGNQEARQELLEVQNAFMKLSGEHREILALVAIEGFEYEEAAVILDIPIGTVRSRLSRARIALKALSDGSSGSDQEGETGQKYREQSRS